MKSRFRLLSLALVSFASLALSGCVVVPPRHYGGPPQAYGSGPVVVQEPYAEVVPAMPFAGAVWIAGSWSWSGGRRYWVPGRWDHPRHGGWHRH